MARNAKHGRRAFLCWCCAGAATLAAAPAGAQNAPPAATGGVTRNILNRAEGPTPQLVSVQVLAGVEAGVTVARHTHPGVETGYILAGGGTLTVKGQPDRVLKPGDHYLITAETPHGFINGPQPTQLLATYVVDKDKPLASPAPA